MSSGEGRPATDRSAAWADLKGKDLVDTILAQRQSRSREAGQVVNATTTNGDIINLGSMPPEALAEFLANRRKRDR